MKWCGLLLLAQLTLLAKPASLYVSTAGNDRWSGSLVAPNAAGSDGPFATLARARDAVRQLKAAGPLPRGGVTVWVAGGLYPQSETLKLSASDSGTDGAPVVYRALPGEQPRLLGGRPITGFKPHQGAIVKAEVAGQGLHGVYFRQLFMNGRRLHLARYPNFDPQNPYGGGWAYADGKPVPMYSDRPGEDKHSLQYKAADARTWARPDEGEVFVFPRYNWWNNLVRIKSVDREQRRIELAGDCSYPIRPTDRYYVRNQFEELDAPGEWYLDRRTETLYLIPPEPLAGSTVYAPALRTVVEMQPGTSNVVLRGLTIECAEGHGVVLNQTSDCTVAACTIRNVGDYNGSGVAVNGGRNSGVLGCDIYEVGRDGVSLSGGDRVTLTPANNYADNNYIHHVGVFYKQGVGVAMWGCGLRAAHNLIHDGPRMGIMFSGNNLLLEYNHIRHVNLETEDTGAIYTGGRDWISSRGTVVRYNYFHDILGYGQMNGRWVSPHFAWGVYLDDNAGGVDVIGNIIARCPRAAIHLHNGRDNLMENNILVDSGMQQLEMNGWTNKHPYWISHLPTMVKGYESVVSQPAWRGMRNMGLHPRLAVLPDGLIMTGNVFRRNILASQRPKARLYRFNNVPFDHYESDRNLIYAGGRPLIIDGLRGVAADEHWAEWQRRGKDQHSIVADPRFVDAAADDYRLADDSPARQIGFKRIPVEQIGPQALPLRATWPIVEAEGAREKPLGAAHPEQIGPPPARPRYEQPFTVPRLPQPPGEAELAGALALSVRETPDRNHIAGQACAAKVGHDGQQLYIELVVPATAAKLRRGEHWGQDDGAEVCLQRLDGKRGGPVFVLHGFLTGRCESVTDAGAAPAEAAAMGRAVQFTATVRADGWIGRWAVPLAALGAKPGGQLAFNLGVRRTEADEWVCWAGALGQTWRVENAGVLLLQP